MGEDDPRMQSSSTIFKQQCSLRHQHHKQFKTAAVTRTHRGEGKLWSSAYHLNMEEETKK